MHAHRTKVTVPESHEIHLDLPNDFPSGPAEVIVLTEARPVGNIVRLGGVLNRAETPVEGDPIAEALQELREERNELLDRRAMRYTTETTDEP